MKTERKAVSGINPIEECPFCKADLRGESIPKDLRKMYAYGSTHYSRLIGIEIPELYDGVSYYECPDCHVRWDRWTGELYYKLLYSRENDRSKRTIGDQIK